MKAFLLRTVPFGLSFFSSLCIMILELVASRLAPKNIGSSLTVWTAIIGVMLGGICLGNVLGGRLADRVEPRRAIGPLYALGAALTLACLWVNEAIGLAMPAFDLLPTDLRTIVVVVLDFLVPSTVLGMIGPVVAKMAVEQSRKAGSAIGLVYFLGAVGSILGTFIAGYYLFSLTKTSTVIMVVAAGLALMSAATFGESRGALLALLAAALLGFGSYESVRPVLGVSVLIRSIPVSLTALIGNLLTFALAVLAWNRLRHERTLVDLEDQPQLADSTGPARGFARLFGGKSGDLEKPLVRLRDLAALAFVASLAFMALEMVASRLVTRHLGSSIYGWTSVIGVLLGGLSLGNYLGGKVADRIKRESAVSWLFLFASMLTAAIVLAETPPRWLIRNPINHWIVAQPTPPPPTECLHCNKPIKIATWGVDCPECHKKIPMPPKQYEPGSPLFGAFDSALSQAISTTYGWLPVDPSTGRLAWTQISMPWWARVLFWTAIVFFLPAVAMGTVSPVVAKLAVERVRQSKRTGAAIGQVYAWGMVGSIVGTFLAGFVLIDLLGTKGVLLVLATMLALSATILGSVWHAAWAGIPLGLCVIAFTPAAWFEKQGVAWGIREEAGDPETEKDTIAYIDESNYYYIKVNNDPDPDGRKRTLVLDNLIHGYFILDHPERLDYDYEHIYALVTRRVAEARAKDEGVPNAARAPLNTLFLGGGSYTFPRYLRKIYPNTAAEIAEIDPSVTKANRIALGLTAEDESRIKTNWGDARQFVENRIGKNPKFDLVFGDAFNDFSVPWHLTTREFNKKIADLLTPNGVYMINIIDIYRSDKTAAEEGLKEAQKQAIARALRRGGMGAAEALAAADDIVGSLNSQQLGVDAEELAKRLDPPLSVAPAKADARDLAGRVIEVLGKEKDLVRGGEKNLTDAAAKTLGRNKWKGPLDAIAQARVGGKTPTTADITAVINDLARAAAQAEVRLGDEPQTFARSVGEAIITARGLGGFLGSWVNTAKQTFPHIYVFGTDTPGAGLRETFVVVASKAPLDLDELGGREFDPRFFDNGKLVEPKAYPPSDMSQLNVRAHGIVLTDDYAPVENLLAPVAATRGED